MHFSYPPAEPGASSCATAVRGMLHLSLSTLAAWPLTSPCRRREQQSARVNRLAEKLLLNQLKQSVLGKVTEAQLRKAAGGQGRGRGSGGRGRGRAARAAAGQDRQEQQEQEFEAGNGSGGGTAAAAASAGSAQMPSSAAIPTSGAATCGARQPMHDQRQASAPAPLAVQGAAATAAAGTWHNEEGPDSSAVAAAAAADSTAADELLAAQLAAEQWDEEEASVALAAAAAGGASGQALQLPSVFSTLSEQRHQERARRRAGQAGGDDGGEGESSGDDDELEIVLPEVGAVQGPGESTRMCQGTGACKQRNHGPASKTAGPACGAPSWGCVAGRTLSRHCARPCCHLCCYQSVLQPSRGARLAPPRRLPAAGRPAGPGCHVHAAALGGPGPHDEDAGAQAGGESAGV